MQNRKLNQKQPRQNNQTTSWGGVSEWYDEYLQDEDTYQAKVIAPNLIRLLNVGGFENGNVVLELGCGQGYFMHHVLDNLPKGIKIDFHGVDISGELLEIAKKDLGSVATFTKSDASKLSTVKDKSIDVMYSVLALQNMSDLSAVMGEVKRVLKKEGAFVAVINHPTFRIPKQSDWYFDKDRNAQGRVVYTYMSDKKFAIDMHPGKTAVGEKKEETFSFHHPLQYYTKIFAKHGLVITRLEEWISHKKSEEGPKKPIEDNARKEIPLFMCIELNSK
ncbi:MAG: class I SAM-dependent methyltransferase [Patescibacteria group bacterium]